MRLKKFSRDNGLWGELWKSWDRECSTYDEDFADFAPSSLSVLRGLAEEPERPAAGVFGLTSEASIPAVCQLNVAALPGYEGKVLRMRHLILSPRFDFSSDVTSEEYGETLGTMFAQIVALANSEMPAQHVKLHFRSPADQQFFSLFKEQIVATRAFQSVQMKGAWLYIS